MSGSAVGPVAIALTAAATASLPAPWTAALGYKVTDDPGPLVMIGGEDPDNPEETSLGTAEQDWASVGLAADRDEVGDITCSARTWNGEGDLIAAVTDTQAALDALAAYLRANPTLGISQLMWVSFGTEIGWFQSFDTEYGVKVRAVFSIHFQALI